MISWNLCSQRKRFEAQLCMCVPRIRELRSLYRGTDILTHTTYTYIYILSIYIYVCVCMSHNKTQHDVFESNYYNIMTYNIGYDKIRQDKI